MIIDFLNQPFHLLDRKDNRLLLSIVTGIYVMLFMNLYIPFNVDQWYKNPTLPLPVILSSFGLIGMAVLMISQLFIKKILKIRTVKMYGVILWFLVELILLTVTMYLIYGTVALGTEGVLNEIFLSFKYTALVIIIPYAGVLFYLHATQKGENIDGLLVASDHLVNILDEHGELHMAVDLEQILFMRSADNYVTVYFIKNEKIHKELVRTSLKRLETELNESPIRRCHRSYMVNINNISVSMKNNQGLALAIKNLPDETIPVSKKYKHFFNKLLKKKDQQTT